jgi:hypothetical protein
MRVRPGGKSRRRAAVALPVPVFFLLTLLRC